MKTPDEINMNAENAFVLRETAKAHSDGYYEHLSHGSKGDPVEERWIEALNAGANALAYIQQLESTVSQVSKALCGKASETSEELLKSARQVKSPWISVKEGLPETFVPVLCYMPGEKPHPTVREGFINEKGVWSAGMYRREPDEVVMWRLMPLPPKED